MNNEIRFLKKKLNWAIAREDAAQIADLRRRITAAYGAARAAQ